MADALAQITIGPSDHGRRMAFWEFQRARAVDGRRYELGRGVIEVTDIPARRHFEVLAKIDEQFVLYRAANPDVIRYYAGGAEAKTEIPALESERHPDRSIYLTPMPDDDYPWDKWVPTIVIEVVSPGRDAHRRDYVTKREEYLAAGVLEYWIVDPQKRALLALTRHGDTWCEHKLAQDGRWATPLLPGFELDVGAVFAA